MSNVILDDGPINLDDYLEAPSEAEHVRSAAAFRERVKERLLSPDPVAGASMGWSKCDDKLRFREGEVTLWAGINGHGKSLVTSQVALNLVADSLQRIGIASFELHPEATLGRMARQAAGSSSIDADFLDRFHAWLDEWLWLYDVQGTVKWQRVIACGRYMATLGIRHFFVDSLMKCVRGEDDYNGQKDFVDALCALAKETRMHIHLVHHIRKGEDEHRRPGKFDAKGSGSITDQVDNVVIVWRNKRKERAKERGEMTEDQRKEPDTVLIVDKQREWPGWEGSLGFWFHQGALQYLERGNEYEARRYVA